VTPLILNQVARSVYYFAKSSIVCFHARGVGKRTNRCRCHLTRCNMLSSGVSPGWMHVNVGRSQAVSYLQRLLQLKYTGHLAAVTLCLIESCSKNTATQPMTTTKVCLPWGQRGLLRLYETVCGALLYM
jgi:hypothetical protein